MREGGGCTVGGAKVERVEGGMLKLKELLYLSIHLGEMFPI